MLLAPSGATWANLGWMLLLTELEELKGTVGSIDISLLADLVTFRACWVQAFATTEVHNLGDKLRQGRVRGTVPSPARREGVGLLHGLQISTRTGIHKHGVIASPNSFSPKNPPRGIGKPGCRFQDE